MRWHPAEGCTAFGRAQRLLVGPQRFGDGAAAHDEESRQVDAGRGKRGGIRVIYYARTREGLIWMLTIYAKSEEQTIPAHMLRKIREEIDG